MVKNLELFSDITWLKPNKKLGEHVFEMYAMLHKTIPHTQVYYQLNFYSLPLKYTKITLMDTCSFSEHKRKCPNRGENKVIPVHQDGFLSQLESFSMVYVLHEHLSQLGTFVARSV